MKNLRKLLFWLKTNKKMGVDTTKCITLLHCEVVNALITTYKRKLMRIINPHLDVREIL